MAWHYVTSLLGATPYGKHTGTIYIGPAIYLFIYLLSHADLLAGHEGGTQSLKISLLRWSLEFWAMWIMAYMEDIL
jgi:hypothetical protein